MRHLLLSFILFAGCQTAEPPTTPHANTQGGGSAAKSSHTGAKARLPSDPNGTLLEKTVLPKGFAREIAAGRITIPGDMISVSAVTRPRAEVRSGPGAQFDLEEFVLEQGTPVVLFDRFGVWQKVLAIGSWKRGWVHAATLGDAVKRREPLTLETKLLPTVLALRPIEVAKTYPEGNPLKVDVPKGALFHSLMFSGPTALVVLPETNSVMWVSRKDVQ